MAGGDAAIIQVGGPHHGIYVVGWRIFTFVQVWKHDDGCWWEREKTRQVIEMEDGEDG